MMIFYLLMNAVDNNYNVDLLDDIENNIFYFNHDYTNSSTAIVDKYDTIELLNGSDDESLCLDDDNFLIEAHVDLQLPKTNSINNAPIINNISSKSLLEHQKIVKEKQVHFLQTITAIDLLSLLRASGCSLTSL